MTTREPARMIMLSVLVPTSVLWVAVAQPPADKGGKGKGAPALVKNDELLKLLSSPAVHRELELLDDQQQQLRELEQNLTAKIKDVVGETDPRQLEPEQLAALRERLKTKEPEWRDWLRRELTDVLLPHQFRRLQQIARQVRGMDLVNDPEIVQQLKLTPSQLEAITKLRAAEKQERDKAKRQVDAVYEGKEAGAVRKEQEALIKSDFDQRIREVLTRAQRRELDELLGEPFDLAQLKGGGAPKEPKPAK